MFTRSLFHIVLVLITYLSLPALAEETTPITLLDGSQKQPPVQCIWAADPEDNTNCVAQWDGAPLGKPCKFSIADKDWSKHNTLQLKIFARDARGQALMVTLESNPSDTKGNYYSQKFTIDWDGWKTVDLSLEKFSKIRTPIGMQDIQQITINSKGWGIEPMPRMQLLLDDIKVVDVKKK